jgi:hypothetical protein
MELLAVLNIFMNGSPASSLRIVYAKENIIKYKNGNRIFALVPVTNISS